MQTFRKLPKAKPISIIKIRIIVLIFSVLVFVYRCRCSYRISSVEARRSKKTFFLVVSGYCPRGISVIPTQCKTRFKESSGRQGAVSQIPFLMVLLKKGYGYVSFIVKSLSFIVSRLKAKPTSKNRYVAET
jgi:hypothetical protein